MPIVLTKNNRSLRTVYSTPSRLDEYDATWDIPMPSGTLSIQFMLVTDALEALFSAHTRGTMNVEFLNWSMDVRVFFSLTRDRAEYRCIVNGDNVVTALVVDSADAVGMIWADLKATLPSLREHVAAELEAAKAEYTSECAKYQRRLRMMLDEESAILRRKIEMYERIAVSSETDA